MPLPLPLPPHQHPLDWFVIPELKGEPISYVAVMKTGCVCRLCDSDKLSTAQMERHYQTPMHREHYFRLQTRRRELYELVQQTEQELLAKQNHHQQQQEHAKHLERQHRAQQDAARQSSDKRIHEQLPLQIVASEKRAVWKGTRDHNVVLMSMRERRRCEDYSGENNSAGSRERVRQLRAQRLATQNQPPPPLLLQNAIPKDTTKQDQKKAKRLAVLEITRRHLQQQKEQEQEEESIVKADKTRTPITQHDDPCLGCMSSSFWQETFFNDQEWQPFS
jgi:hypothetical protein